MTFIQTIPQDQATGEILDLYRREQGGLDYLPNYAGVFCHRPQVMQAWADLQRALRQHLDARSFGLVTLASALALGSSYCSLAHAKKLIQKFYTEREMIAIVADESDSPLSYADRAMMSFAAKVVGDAPAVTQADINRLREAGFSDAGIFDIVAAAAGRCFFARIPDALGTQPDASLGCMDQTLLGLLTVGRPLAEEKRK